MIRSFLLDHEIEAHVLHENADCLWSGAVAECVVAVHETDVEFLNEAFSAPREALTDESQLPESEFVEQDSPPLRFGWDFFFRSGLVGIAFLWGFVLVSLVFVFVDTFPNTVRSQESAVLQINLMDIIFPTVCGFLGGLLCALAMLVARTVRRDENGRRSFIGHCVVLCVVFFTYNPLFPILWWLCSLFQ